MQFQTGHKKILNLGKELEPGKGGVKGKGIKEAKTKTHFTIGLGGCAWKRTGATSGVPLIGGRGGPHNFPAEKRLLVYKKKTLGAELFRGKRCGKRAHWEELEILMRKRLDFRS